MNQTQAEIEETSIPFRCEKCGGNVWHVFEGAVTVRLRCATPTCRGAGPGRPVRLTRHWRKQ